MPGPGKEWGHRETFRIQQTLHRCHQAPYGEVSNLGLRSRKGPTFKVKPGRVVGQLTPQMATKTFPHLFSVQTKTSTLLYRHIHPRYHQTNVLDTQLQTCEVWGDRLSSDAGNPIFCAHHSLPSTASSKGPTREKAMKSNSVLTRVEPHRDTYSRGCAGR